MPRILFRHITADLLRIKLLTASVLVAVIAFGAAIRPIMQNLLGADDVIQYVALASVPMLQFALPFAGAFAGTIVYARLAADNEILAMSAAGLSYRRILMPAFGVGVMLFIVMAVLVDAGVPRFWTSMRMLITRDVTRLFVSSVEHGEALTEGATYRESAAQLVLMAFLQRVVNGGGVVTREYGIGRKRIDLLVSWPYTDESGKKQLQREARRLGIPLSVKGVKRNKASLSRAISYRH